MARGEKMSDTMDEQEEVIEKAPEEMTLAKDEWERRWNRLNLNHQTQNGI